MSSPSSTRNPVRIEDFKAAIKDVANEDLERIKSEIENSVQHLRRSNRRLHQYIARLKGVAVDNSEDADDELDLDNVNTNDIQLFSESIKENDLVLQNYQERLDAIEDEKVYRCTGAAPLTSGTAERDSTIRKSASTTDMDNSNVDTVAPNSVYI